MEEPQPDQETLLKHMYHYASELYEAGQNSHEVRATLIERGLDEQNAAYIINIF